MLAKQNREKCQKNSNRLTHIFTTKNSYLNGCRSAAAAVMGTVDGDADALMNCKQTTSGILTPDQNIYAVTVQRQPALQETGEQNSVCVRVSGVSWHPLANVSPGRLRRAIQTCYLSASTVLASASAAVGAGNNVGRCVDTGSVGQRGWSLHTQYTYGQAHLALCRPSGLKLSIGVS